MADKYTTTQTTAFAESLAKLLTEITGEEYAHDIGMHSIYPKSSYPDHPDKAIFYGSSGKDGLERLNNYLYLTRLVADAKDKQFSERLAPLKELFEKEGDRKNTEILKEEIDELEQER